MSTTNTNTLPAQLAENEERLSLAQRFLTNLENTLKGLLNIEKSEASLSDMVFDFPSKKEPVAHSDLEYFLAIAG